MIPRGTASPGAVPRPAHPKRGQTMTPPTLLDPPRCANRALLVAALLILLVGLVTALLSGLDENPPSAGTTSPTAASAQPASTG